MEFLYDADLSDLASDEGPLFGHQGIGPWALLREDVEAWLLRPN